MKTPYLHLALALVAASCWSCDQKRTDEKADEELRQLAGVLAVRDLIVDGHVDLPDRLFKEKLPNEALKSVLTHTSRGDFDTDRARKGGLDAPFMSIYIPSSYQKQKGAAQVYDDSLIH